MQSAPQRQGEEPPTCAGPLPATTDVQPPQPAAQAPARPRRRHERGQNLVELAILLPVWLVLILGTVDLARVYNAYTALQNVARVGARYGATHPTDTTGIRAVAAREMQNSGLSIPTSNITVSCPAGACMPGYPINVTATYNAPLLTTYVAGITSITLRTSVQFVVI